MKVLKIKQKEALYAALRLSYSGEGTPNWGAGTYTVYAIKKLSALDTAYSEANTDYLFRILDAEIKESSPNIDDGRIRLGLDKDKTNIDKEFYLRIVAEFDTYSRLKGTVKVLITETGVN